MRVIVVYLVGCIMTSIAAGGLCNIKSSALKINFPVQRQVTTIVCFPVSGTLEVVGRVFFSPVSQSASLRHGFMLEDDRNITFLSICTTKRC